MFKKLILYIFLIFITFNSFSNTTLYKILYYDSLIPKMIDLRKRVLTTICCDDCNDLPKVENAGKVFTENQNTFQLMHNGIKIIKDCYYGNWMTTIIENLKGHHEPQEEKIFHEILKFIPENSVMLELGCYWGYYSMWFQKQVLNSKNYLIEPDPNNLIIGKNNFILNNMAGVFTNAMVGSSSKNSQVFTDWNHNKHVIRQVNIDDFASENNINFIHMLHSDIQGAEMDMLKGCKNLIAQKRIGYFFVSTHRGTHQDCLKILEDAKLEILISHTREESFSADGLIIAKLPGINGPLKLEISRRTDRFCKLIDGIIE